MRILLTHPLTSFILHPPGIPDLGLGYIAAQLKKRGVEVSIRDWNMAPDPESFKKWLAVHNPQIVGMKIFTKDAGAAKKSVDIIKEILPKTLIVIGGPHPSASSPVEIMNEFPLCDFAFQGDAEFSFPELVSLLVEELNKKEWKDINTDRFNNINGLVWRENGAIHSNSPQLIKNLDKIDFPAWELIPPPEYVKNLDSMSLPLKITAPIIGTRGCPENCSFCCAYRVNGRAIRFRSAENIFDELWFLYKTYGVERFMFVDNCFLSDEKRITDLCNLIIQKDMKIEWDCIYYERMIKLSDPLLSLMCRSGCRLMLMGIETGSPRILKEIKRHTTLQDYSGDRELLKKHGIQVNAFFMIGFPNETWKDVIQTIHYAFSLKADMLAFEICFPLPGTRVYEFLKKKYGIDQIQWKGFNVYKSPYPMSKLSTPTLIVFFKFLKSLIFFKNRLSKLLKKRL